MVLRNIPVVEIRDPKIEQDIKKKGEIKYFEVESIIHHSGDDLYIPIDCENPDWFYQEVKQKQQPQVCQKFSLHIKKVKSSMKQKLFVNTWKIIQIFATKLIIKLLSYHNNSFFPFLK